jgi:hypothetical protein
MQTFWIQSIWLPGGNQTKQSTYSSWHLPKSLCRNIRFGNMPESAAIRKNVRENCRALIVRGYDEWGWRSIAFGLQCTAFDRVLVLYEKAFDMTE